jgi:glycosyltransferase involved in cell wall biosynthesis
MRRIQKIAFITGSMATGGAERVIATLSNEFAKSGIEVIVFCISKTASNVAYDYDPRVSLIGIHTNLRGFVIRKFTQLWRLRSLVKAFRPDSIIAFQDYINIQTIVACCGLGIPITISIRADPAIATNICKISTRFLYRFADCAVFQTREQKDFYTAYKKRRDAIILNPVDISKITTTNRENKGHYMIAVGRLTSEKNYQLLLKAFHLISKEFPYVELVILGDGEQRGELERLRAELDLEKRVCFTGMTDNVFEYTASARVFVMTSICEGLPNALIEAMCLGVPCISTRFSGGGAETLIQDGVNGLLVPNGDCGVLADAMRRLLSDDKLAQYLGENAKALRQKVDTLTIVNEWLDFLE